MKRVLFVCTHNSARSQMAEGLLNHRYGGRFEAWSAGTTPRGVHPMAVDVMEEIGIDISDHTSKSVGEVVRELGVRVADEAGDADPYAGAPFDVVITVCDDAKENCPYVPAREGNIHAEFDDPSAAEGTEEEKREAFRRVRGELAEWLDTAFAPATDRDASSPSPLDS